MDNLKSRLAELLGVKEDEQFKVKGCKENVYRIHNGVREVLLPGRWERMDSEAALTEIINDPSRVIREPRFSDEEMNVLRVLWMMGIGKIERSAFLGKSYHFSRTSAHKAGNRICPYLKNILRPGESVDLEAMFGGED